jgi:membrane fusion protein, multidrug efflux system
MKTTNKPKQMMKPSVRRINGFSLSWMILAAIVFMVSCGNEAHKSDADSIRAEISAYQQQINDMTLKVGELERKLEAMGEQPVNRARVAVEVFEIQPQPFEHFFRVNGTVEAGREAMISPEMNGQLTKISVVKGQRVSSGQEVARLNTSVIENNIEEVKTSLRLAKTVYERQKGLWEQEIGSEIQFLEARNNYEGLQTRLKTLESQLEMAVMRAAFSGIVDDIFLKEGELAMPGMPVMQIISLGRVYVNADIAESFLPRIDSKEIVTLRFPTFPDFEARVPVHRLGNVINPENRTFRLQLRIDNPGEKFKPNMVASVSIRSFATDEALVLPSILIRQDVQGHFVFTAQQNGIGELIARKSYIERGPDSEGQTMIISGLKPGDRIIQRGHNQVGEGTLIRID